MNEQFLKKKPCKICNSFQLNQFENILCRLNCSINKIQTNNKTFSTFKIFSDLFNFVKLVKSSVNRNLNHSKVKIILSNYSIQYFKMIFVCICKQMSFIRGNIQGNTLIMLIIFQNILVTPF